MDGTMRRQHDPGKLGARLVYGPEICPPHCHGRPYRFARPWVRRPYDGTIVAGAAPGTRITVAAVGAVLRVGLLTSAGIGPIPTPIAATGIIATRLGQPARECSMRVRRPVLVGNVMARMRSERREALAVGMEPGKARCR
jgi:hypothetical protein